MDLFNVYNNKKNIAFKKVIRGEYNKVTKYKY